MPTVDPRLQTYSIQLKLRLTASRILIFEHIKAHSGSIEAEIVHTLTGTVSAPSVYRTCRIFIQAGIIWRRPDGGLELSDTFVQHHHALVCRICGQRTTFFSPQIENSLARYHHDAITIEDHYLEFTGLCARCAKSHPARSPRAPQDLRRPPLTP